MELREGYDRLAAGECPLCGYPLDGYLCRLVCPNCGYKEDCSDTFGGGPMESPEEHLEDPHPETVGKTRLR